MLGLKHITVKLVPHTYKWRYLFQEEVIRIRRALKSPSLDIQHVGSTAVPDIAAKPILDIFISCEDLSISDHYLEALTRLGYELVTTNQTYKLFIKGDEEARTHHLTFTSPKGNYWNETIKFRNHLLDNPQVAKNYELEKIKLATEYPTSRRNYSSNKARFIQKTLRDINKKALEANKPLASKSDYVVQPQAIPITLNDMEDFSGVEQTSLFITPEYKALNDISPRRV